MSGDEAAQRDYHLARAAVPCVQARIELDPENGDTYYDVNAEGYLIVHVRTHQHGVSIWANLRGGPSWQIPPVGTEGVCLFDAFSDDGFEGEAYFVPFSKAPTGLAPGQVFVLGSEVEVRSAGGVAVKLATLADVQAVQSALNGHAHTYIPGSGAPVLTTLNPAVPAPTGTTVLKGE